MLGSFDYFLLLSLSQPHEQRIQGIYDEFDTIWLIVNLIASACGAIVKITACVSDEVQSPLGPKQSDAVSSVRLIREHWSGGSELLASPCLPSSQLG
jgi:hypothetical protein